MIFAALAEAAEKDELILVADGFCRFHKRRDGVVVIREILVLPLRRRTGIGRRLLRHVMDKNPGNTLLAKCPASYLSNGWWSHMGFHKVAEGEINTWQYP